MTDIAEITDTIVGGAATINWGAGDFHFVRLASGANTLTFTNPVAGGCYMLWIQQPASGAAGTVTFSPTASWPGGITPTLTTTNSKIDIMTFQYSTAAGGIYAGGINQNY